MPQTSATAGYTDGYRALGDDLRALAAPGEDLAALAARLRAVAATVEAQAAAHRALLVLDWSGDAATAFAGLVALRAQHLQGLSGALHDVADAAGRRAAAGEALRASAGWAS